MKQPRKLVVSFLKRPHYRQGVAAYPIFLNAAALSGFFMRPFKFHYTEFLFHYRDGYGIMNYLKSDLEHIWDTISPKLYQKSFIGHLMASHGKIFNREAVALRVQNLKLSTVPNTLLLQEAKRAVIALRDAVGPAHALEAIDFKSDAELRDKLAYEMGDMSKVNRIYSRLVIPERISYMVAEEKDLLKIARYKSLEKRREALKRHLNRYFFVGNSYVGASHLTTRFFEQKLRRLHTNQKKVTPTPRIQQPQDLKLSRKTKMLIRSIRRATLWKDERKQNILVGIHYLSLCLEEIAKRLKINKTLLFHLGPRELVMSNTLRDIARLAVKAGPRTKGCFVIQRNEVEYFVTGRPYQLLTRLEHRILEEKKKKVRDIFGTIANLGYARGQAKIISNRASYGKFKPGDILVASMTRPELMPLLRIASAVVTNEGGMTSHAAIVCRELGIPCIIGTQIATEVLKDGDMVEVDANHGWVRKLKK